MTYRFCLLNGSNSMDFTMGLPDGRTLVSDLQAGNCRDVAVTSLTIAPSCWEIPHAGHFCKSYHYYSHCANGQGTNSVPDVKVWSVGWSEASLLPATDNLLKKATYFRFFSSRARIVYILNSMNTALVNLCLKPIGVTIHYDQNDPFGASSPQTFKTTQYCTPVNAKAVWLYPNASVNGISGTYQITY
jgi:hypothetical protein